MTGATGLIVAMAGCTDALGSESNVLLDLTASNQTTEADLPVRIVIQDDGETIFNEEYELEVADEEPSETLEGIVSAPNGSELTVRVVLSDHEEVETVTIDCPEEARDGGVTVNDTLFVAITDTDQVDVSHNGCA